MWWLNPSFWFGTFSRYQWQFHTSLCVIITSVNLTSDAFGLCGWSDRFWTKRFNALFDSSRRNTTPLFLKFDQFWLITVRLLVEVPVSRWCPSSQDVCNSAVIHANPTTGFWFINTRETLKGCHRVCHLIICYSLKASSIPPASNRNYQPEPEECLPIWMPDQNTVLQEPETNLRAIFQCIGHH